MNVTAKFMKKCLAMRETDGKAYVKQHLTEHSVVRSSLRHERARR